MSSDTIREVTQSLIALAVVVGGGVIMYLQPDSAAVPFISGTMGAIIGFYFSRSQSQGMATRAANHAVDAMGLHFERVEKKVDTVSEAVNGINRQALRNQAVVSEGIGFDKGVTASAQVAAANVTAKETTP